jgi:hypothetical protein
MGLLSGLWMAFPPLEFLPTNNAGRFWILRRLQIFASPFPAPAPAWAHLDTFLDTLSWAVTMQSNKILTTDGHSLQTRLEHSKNK